MSCLLSMLPRGFNPLATRWHQTTKVCATILLVAVFVTEVFLNTGDITIKALQRVLYHSADRIYQFTGGTNITVSIHLNTHTILLGERYLAIICL